MVPIQGEVIYDGQPLTEGQVVYLPSNSGVGRQATGAIQPDGTFVMTTKDKADGVMHGDYNIAIFAYKPHPGEPKSREEMEAIAESGGIRREHIIPERYASPATSGLTDEVDASHSGFHRIELTK